MNVICLTPQLFGLEFGQFVARHQLLKFTDVIVSLRSFGCLFCPPYFIILTKLCKEILYLLGKLKPSKLNEFIFERSLNKGFLAKENSSSVCLDRPETVSEQDGNRRNKQRKTWGKVKRGRIGTNSKGEG